MYVCNANPQSSKCTLSTSHSFWIFGLGSGLVQDDSIITGSRLPNCRLVLRCFMWYLSDGSSENRTKWESANIVLSQVSTFYKANIPLISERKACEKIIKLLDENAKLQAIPLKRRTSPSTLEKLQKMEKKTFALWPQNAESLVKNKEDLYYF